MTEILKVKRLVATAKLPQKAFWNDWGYDLYAAEDAAIHTGDVGVISTGIACVFPPGFGGLIMDRSSMASKRRLFVVGGVIDGSYTGAIKICLYNAGIFQHIRAGEKIAQMIVGPIYGGRVEEIDELPVTDRGAGGFGSTGT